jgi:8-oxo-dGTP pyrophosphatase MutT (NUDIX family)
MYPIPVVRLIIADKMGKVLILKRHNTKYFPGSWCLPGGKIDYGERIEEVIAKEVREETSLICRSSSFLFCQESLPPEPEGMHCINLYFECDVSGTIVLNDESSEFAWIGPSDLDKYDIVFRNDLALMRYWKEKG